MKKVVLAFSGGLDTSYCAIYLSKEMGLEVHAALANTGGFSAEELASIEKRAYDLGVKSRPDHRSAAGALGLRHHHL